MQDWRAIARFRDSEALITFGSSQFEVTQTYQEAFLEIIHPDIRNLCHRIVLQRWKGEPTRGKWIDIGIMRLPAM